MNKILLFLIVWTAGIAVMKAEDYQTFGFKGKIKSAEIGQYRVIFDTEGNVTACYFQGSNFFLPVDNMSRSLSGFVGDYKGEKISIIVKGGKISSTSMVYRNDTYTSNYSYNSDGFISQVITTKSWEDEVYEYQQGSAKVDSKNAATYEKLFKEALKKGNTAEYNKYKNLYEKAVKAANVNVRQSSVSTKKQKHTESNTATFTYTKKDRYGNWTERIRHNKGEKHVETQEIEYEPEFLCQYEWQHDVLPTNTLDAIEAFYSKKSCTPYYKQIAKNAWNEKIMSFIGDDVDLMLDASNKEIMSDVNRQMCVMAIRESVYNNRVLPEKDFARVSELADLKNAYGLIFDSEYRNKILQRSKELRADSIKKLIDQGQNELSAQNYKDASRTAQQVLQIDMANNTAIQMRAKADHKILMQKEANQTISEQDYADFLRNNPKSEYEIQVCNDRAMLALSKLSKTSTEKEFLHVDSLPTSGATAEYINKQLSELKKANKRYLHHRYFLDFRGKFVHVGFAANTGGGKGTFEYSGGIGLRFGWHISFLNVYLGAELQKLCYLRFPEKEQDYVPLTEGGYLSAARYNFPAALRFNIWRDRVDYDKNVYLSLGGIYNLTMKGKYCFDADGKGKPEWVNDKKVVKNGTITPRVALGYCKKKFEIELYGTLEPKEGVFDKEYINNNLMPLFDPNIVSKQIDNRFRCGITMRGLF